MSLPTDDSTPARAAGDPASGEDAGDERQPGLRLLVAAPGLTAAHPLPDSGQVVIGRSRSADIRIDVACVSRRHAILRLGRTVTIEDVGSANGTRVAGVRIAADRATKLAAGDVIELGDVMVIVKGMPALDEQADDAGVDKVDLDADAVVLDAAVLREARELAERAATEDVGVLLIGEPGVGKEALARRIHQRSPRAGKPFVVLRCAGNSKEQVENELFGHEKGSFTGAGSTQPGVLEAARGGTVFLDDVGELSAPVQTELRRVLEDGEVIRVGGVQPRSIDVRIVAATRHDLAMDVETRRFRADLYQRLSAIAIAIAPLRENLDEIASLTRAFVDHACRKLGQDPAYAVSETAAEVLAKHSWPGNVRELREAVQYAVLLCHGDTIEVDHLPGTLNPGARAAQTGPGLEADAGIHGARGGSFSRDGSPYGAPGDSGGLDSDEPRASAIDIAALEAPTLQLQWEGGKLRQQQASADLRTAMRKYERERLIEVLQRCGGNESKAATLLRVSHATLIARLDEHGLPHSGSDDSDD